MRENKFQSDLIRELKDRFPGCLVMKLDASYIQAIPDLLVLYRNKWAVLECKRSEEAFRKSLKDNPNQLYYVNLLDGMSFASFIFPENKEDVLYDLERSFKIKRNTRRSKS
jgi:hypothetical protein